MDNRNQKNPVEEKIRKLNSFLEERGLPPSKPGNRTGAVIIVRRMTSSERREEKREDQE